MLAHEGPRVSGLPGRRRRSPRARPSGRGAPAAGLGLALLLALAAAPASAWYDVGDGDVPPSARGIHIIDGSYVMNVGQLQVNITNWGLIGSRFTTLTAYADAPSGQWPGGSGIEYLWGMGIWIGAKMGEGEPRVSTGQPQAELRPRSGIEDTIYEAVDGRIVRPPGNPAAAGARMVDDDRDGRVDEDTPDGRDDDGDGRIDEDFGQIGDQMMVCTMYDDTRLAREIYPDHQPLGLKVVQESCAWENQDYDDFVAFRYVLTNIGQQTLRDLYVGLYVDCDIGRRGQSDVGRDDLTGYWAGRVRSAEGYFSTVQVAYMYDGAEQDRVPGYIGAMLLGGAGSGFSWISGYRVWSGRQSYEQGGEPTIDPQRYEVLASRWRDWNAEPGDEADYRFLLSAGPLLALHVGGSVAFDAALVMGGDLDELLENCANVERAWFGEYMDADGDPQTGVAGRETWTCAEWWPLNPSGRHSMLYDLDARYIDIWCLSPDTPRRPIEIGETTLDALGNHCLWVNMDNCDECMRQMGTPCTVRNRLFEKWDCGLDRFRPPAELTHCTGVDGRETQVPWIVSRNAPPSPSLRVATDHGAVHLFWDDASEHAPDPVSGLCDFESYMIWRADHWARPPGTSEENGPLTESWQLLGEFDLVDEFERSWRVDGQIHTVVEPLGGNTGLEGIAYRPVCLDDPRFAGLAEAMQGVVDADTTGRYVVRPTLRRTDGSPVPGLEPLLAWEGWPAVLDTFFMVAQRPAAPARRDPGKRGVRFYEYVDEGLHDGFIYFYSVTASDHEVAFIEGEPHIIGSGLHGSPGASFVTAVPGPRPETAAHRRAYGADIYVYPDPATRESLAEFQQLHPNAHDPSGVRVVFNNLPRARNRIRIYTLDGDLVADLRHDGTLGSGQLPWNLVSRNGQQVASGIYLYRVESDDGAFPGFTGRFVVVR